MGTNKGISGGRATPKALRLMMAAVLLACAGRALNTGAQTVTNLHNFAGPPNDGGNPYAGLVQGNDGYFYGTTYYGGTNSCNCGSVFRTGPNGSYTNLYSFGSFANDGRHPDRGLVQGSDGNFYGTTSDGGTNGDGTVFRISPNGGGYTNLHVFAGYPIDGSFPEGLVQGSDGNFYGTTSDGGTSTNCSVGVTNYVGCGTVFRISPGGSLTDLWSFTGDPSGANPAAELVQGSDGNFYGTTHSGGNAGEGAVFRITPGGSYTDFYSFGSPSYDGEYPYAALAQGSDGNFYGTTHDGGTSSNGTVFRISPGGDYTNLYSFGSPASDGNNPYAGLVQGSDGNFYGTTFGGGGNSCNCGAVFRISPGGSYTNLHRFTGPPNDGANSAAGLVQGSDGNFYGTTYSGGTHSNGAVFRLSVSLNPPANQISGIKVTPTNSIFSIPTVAGETYQLQARNALPSGTWSNVPGVSLTNSIGGSLTFTNAGAATPPQEFYRFDITP